MLLLLNSVWFSVLDRFVLHGVFLLLSSLLLLNGVYSSSVLNSAEVWIQNLDEILYL